MLFKIPPEALQIVSTLEQNDFETYLIGGCVRDFLMGFTPKDYDIATSALPEQVCSLFPKTIPTGLKHGTVTVLNNRIPIEITTFREETDYSDHRHPDAVRFSSSLLQDLKRRDFTMNAIAYHPHSGVIDPFGGVDDIQKHVIRTVGSPEERFSEDALRMLRAIRFQSRFGFQIEKNTENAIHAMANMLAFISRERILCEMNHILTGNFSDAILILFKTGLVRYILPVEIPKVPDVSVFPRLQQKLSVRWAAFFKQSGLIHAKTLQTLCGHLKMSNVLKKDILQITSIINSDLPDTPYRLRKMLSTAGIGIFTDSINLLQVIGQDLTSSGKISLLLEELRRENHCTHPSKLSVNGRDLMAEEIPPGKQLGSILDSLFLCVLQNPALNRKDILLLFAKEIHAKYSFLPLCKASSPEVGGTDF